MNRWEIKYPQQLADVYLAKVCICRLKLYYGSFHIVDVEWTAARLPIISL
jgi:hypothetical protein